jgi:hypothetical protein
LARALQFADDFLELSTLRELRLDLADVRALLLRLGDLLLEGSVRCALLFELTVRAQVYEEQQHPPSEHTEQKRGTPELRGAARSCGAFGSGK